MTYIDIDGVLNDYPMTYIDFLSDKTGKNFDTLNQAKINIPYYNYIRLRETYRKKIEPFLDVRKKVVDILNSCSPYNRVVVTKRPVNCYSHLSNTIQWLKSSRLLYSHLVYWNKDIHDINIPFEVRYCKLAIEDNFKIAKVLAGVLKIPTFVLLNDNNRHYIKLGGPDTVRFGGVDSLYKFLYEGGCK